jgi:hypothetical protein
MILVNPLSCLITRPIFTKILSSIQSLDHKNHIDTKVGQKSGYSV